MCLPRSSSVTSLRSKGLQDRSRSLNRARLIAVVVVLAGLASAPLASAYGESHPNPQAVANCEANVAKQFDAGVAAGGGKKEGIPAPTNCDHLFNP
jgi:hypothetical protein